MAFEIYLNFSDGKAEEAIKLYEKVFNGKRHPDIMRFKDVEGFPLKPSEASYIMHAEMGIDNIVLNFSDVTDQTPYQRGNNISIMVTCDSSEKVEDIFNQLSIDGHVRTKPQETFFAEKYCEFEDRYGIWWQLIYHAKTN